MEFNYFWLVFNNTVDINGSRLWTKQLKYHFSSSVCGCWWSRVIRNCFLSVCVREFVISAEHLVCKGTLWLVRLTGQHDDWSQLEKCCADWLGPTKVPGVWLSLRSLSRSCHGEILEGLVIFDLSLLKTAFQQIYSWGCIRRPIWENILLRNLFEGVGCLMFKPQFFVFLLWLSWV